MRAVAMMDFDSGASLQELPVPEPASNELLVRVYGSSVNGMDMGIAGGHMKDMMEYEFPVVLGRDFAGVVEGVGPAVSRYRVGDEVIGFVSKPTLHDGTWADYVVVPEDGQLAPKPTSLDFGQAGALPLAGASAVLAVEAVAPGAGESVLVVGAGGGVGGYVVQMAAGRGAHVIATARPEDEERLRALGVAETIDYTASDVAAAVRERHPEGVHVLVDCVPWAPTWSDALTELAAKVVREGGRVVSTLNAVRPEELEARNITGTNVMAIFQTGGVARVAELADAGKLTVPVDTVRPLTEAVAALEQFARGKRGKIIITVADQ